MLFTSPVFLAFLVPVLLAYWLIPNRIARLVVLAIASAVFYVAGAGADTVVLVAAIGIGYLGGRGMEALPRLSGWILLASILCCLALLGVYKYTNFILINLAPLTHAPAPQSSFMAPPLGLSFFLFEIISYLVDIRRGVSTPQRSTLNFSLYVGFFPHLIAGPIVRTRQMMPQFLIPRAWSLSNFLSGCQLFIEGMAKKLLLADVCGRVADRIFLSPHDWNSASTALGVIAYTVQIWGDFSGYTDMGRGVARMLGYELPQNFLRPYLAISPRDFWRRWHVTLSTWLRDYLYVPLGGNRGGAIITYRNLMLTMLLGGLWHGAAWTFVIWGAYHGALLVIDHAFGRFFPRLRIPAVLGWIGTLLAVMNGWILFRATGVDAYLEILKGLRRFGAGQALPLADMALVGACAAATIICMAIAEFAPKIVTSARALRPVQGLAYGAVFAGMTYFASIGSAPFIYFQF